MEFKLQLKDNCGIFRLPELKYLDIDWKRLVKQFTPHLWSLAFGVRLFSILVKNIAVYKGLVYKTGSPLHSKTSWIPKKNISQHPETNTQRSFHRLSINLLLPNFLNLTL